MQPTTAAPRAAAEAATRRTRAAARKDVVATATAGSAGAVTSPSPPAPPAKRKRKHPQPVEPTSGHNGAEAERMGAIPQLDGDVSLGAETASLPATPPPLPAPPPTPTLPPPITPATVKNPCTVCNVTPIFNYECAKSTLLQRLSIGLDITFSNTCMIIANLSVKNEIYTRCFRANVQNMSSIYSQSLGINAYFSFS
jgi:hypothetical protein